MSLKFTFLKTLLTYICRFLKKYWINTQLTQYIFTQWDFIKILNGYNDNQKTLEKKDDIYTQAMPFYSPMKMRQINFPVLCTEYRPISLDKWFIKLLVKLFAL